ncbi:MAG: MerR family transcriptional regulator [Bdellovibrionales bacterium]|nr:MerR family transcriptional regulator [Massilia sp.]
MMLKVGELAKRSGLTVRALHHYDSIGLLCPSARSDAGYRLYNRTDIARLHQIQALRRFGMALSDIGSFLAGPGSDLPAIVDQQIGALTRQIEQASVLRTQLTRLQGQLAAGNEPDLGEWLTTLEHMTMYDKYLSKEQRDRLPFFNGANDTIAQWDALVAQMRAHQQAGAAPSEAAVQQLALAWMGMLVRDTGGDAALAAGLTDLNDNEPAMREQNGITPELTGYVMQALAAFRMNIFRKYLDDDEYAFMQANYPKHGRAMPALIARIGQQMADGVRPDAPEASQLAEQWMALFEVYAGKNPATHAKFRCAYANEPDLLKGTFVNPDLLAWIREAISAAAQRTGA